jgi:DNA-binding NtrC family response regulator
MATKSAVCILDDEPIVGDRLKPEMEDEGYEVEVFTDSGSAIQRLTERCFDIFVTDLKMEGVDGMGFLEKVKEFCPRSEVIIITGYATIETARESFVRGAYDFIAKPFRIGEIRDAVKKARRRERKNHTDARKRREKHA